MTEEIVLTVLGDVDRIQVGLRDFSGELIAPTEVLLEPLEDILYRWLQLREQPTWPEESVCALGKDLSRALVQGRVRTELRHWIMEVLARQNAVRLSIDCQHPVWRGLPFEYLRFEEDQDALVLLSGRRLCRRAEERTPERRQPPPELRIAIFSADPDTSRFPKLSWLNQEAKSIRMVFRHFHPFEVSIRTVLDVVPGVMERNLREFKPHIVHFAGHAEATATGGLLALQGEASNTARLLPAAEFARWLRASGVELLFLAACNTAGSLDAFGATVQREGQVPFVVAMQAMARDAFWPQFSRAFYGAIASGSSVCDAMAEARHFLVGVGGAWGIPTLSISAEPKPFVTERGDRTAAPSETNLPKFDRKVWGRERETSEVVDAIARGTHRLMTLTGPGGIGKTCLAVHAARHLCSDFPDGVWFVDCSSANNPEELFTTIAMTLQKGAGDASPEAAFEILKEKALLLVLDRFEHLVMAGHSNAVSDLLHRAQSISILATSRSLLKLPKERAYEVPPLAAGVELFVDSSFLERRRLTEDDLATIALICERLDGLPWSIIVAAGRTQILSPAQLLAYLNQSALGTLRGEELNEDLLKLVPEPDRRLLWKLSVFNGSFTWEDVVAVYDDDRHNLLDGIQRLAEQSLLNRVGQRRFKLFDIVREYTDGLLDDEASAKERQTAKMRHAAHFCCEAERVEAAAVWEALENFRAAILWCGEGEAYPQVARFAYALSNTLMEGGLWPDFDLLTSFAHKAADELSDARLTANLFGWQGAKEARQGKDALCRKLWRKRAEICIEIRDYVGAADALIDIAVQILEHDLEGFEDAAQLLSEAEDLLNKKPGAAQDLLATVAILMARTELKLNHRELALRYLEKAHQASLTITSQGHAVLFVRLNEGHFWRESGDYPKAETAYINVVEAAKASKRYAQVGAALRRLGFMYEQRGHLETAYLCLLGDVEMMKKIGSHKAKAAKEALRQFVERNPRDWEYLQGQGDLVEEILKRAPLLG